MTATTSKDMLAILQRSLIPAGEWPRGLLAIEVEAPRPRVQYKRRGKTRSRKTGPRRRIDAVWAPAGEARLIGYEIKVSRADLRVELNDPEKSALWVSYVNEFNLFLSDPSLVSGLEDKVPPTWGIVCPPARPGWRKLTVLREPSELVPLHQEEAWCRLTSWQSWQRWTEGITAATEIRELEGTLNYKQRVIDGLTNGAAA